MKKKNKILILIGIILLICALLISVFTYFYINKQIEIMKESELEKRKQELVDEYEALDQYIGINSCFLGTVNKNEWKSANEYSENSSFKLNVKSNVEKYDYTAEDILENKSFYLYNEEKFMGKKSDIFYDKDLEPMYYTDINCFRFNIYKYIENEKDLNIETSKVLDTNYANRYESISTDKFNEYEKYVTQVLAEKNIKPANVNIDKVIFADCDLDGENEIYILANSEYNSDYENVTEGLYSLILKVVNDDVKVILERTVSDKEIKNIAQMEKCFNIDMTLIDFNNDGKLEIVAQAILWDIPEIFVIRINELNEEELCLYGCFAW